MYCILIGIIYYNYLYQLNKFINENYILPIRTAVRILYTDDFLNILLLYILRVGGKGGAEIEIEKASSYT